MYSVLSHYQIIHDYNTLEVHDNIYYEYYHINYHEPQVCCGFTPKYGLGRQFQWHIGELAIVNGQRGNLLKQQVP